MQIRPVCVQMRKPRRVPQKRWRRTGISVTLIDNFYGRAVVVHCSDALGAEERTDG